MATRRVARVFGNQSPRATESTGRGGREPVVKSATAAVMPVAPSSPASGCERGLKSSAAKKPKLETKREAKRELFDFDKAGDSQSLVDSEAEKSEVEGKQPKSKRKAPAAKETEWKQKLVKPAKETTPDVVAESEAEAETEQISHEMQKLLESFGADVSKNLLSKKKKLEQYTASCLKSGSQKMEEIWQQQQAQRQKLQEDYQQQTSAIFAQWSTDLEKTLENEEKLQNQMRQQQKLFQQVRIVQTQRMNALKEILASHSKNLEELEKEHESQQAGTQAEMKKEMELLQKKILMDCQQHEMANVRKSLQSLFY